jgi:hypothetical protein
MAAVTVSGYNITRAEDMETSPTIADIGAGAGGGTETVTYLQGSQSVSRKVTNTALRGTGVTTGVAYVTPEAWLAKIYLSDYLDVNSNGLILRVGDPAGAYNQWLLADDGTYGDREYPILGGWLVVLVGLTQQGLIDVTTETAAPDIIPYESVFNGGNGGAEDFQVAAGLATGVAKSENIFIDAIDLVDVWGGLRITGGTESDDRGGFNDFVSHDEGTGSNRYGIVVTKEGIIFVNSSLWIGDEISDIAFEDSNQTLVWPGGLVGGHRSGSPDDHFNSLTIGPTVDSTVVLSSNTFIGKGHTPKRIGFNSRSTSGTGGVNGDVAASNVLTTASGLNFQTGDPVSFADFFDSNSIPVTNFRTYFARRISDTTFTLHPYRDDAYANTNIVTATAAASVEPHAFTSFWDGRPKLRVLNANGTISISSCSFSNFGDSSVRSNTTLQDSTFINCDEIDANNDGVNSIDGCTFESEILYPDKCQIKIDDPSDISNCSFIGGFEGGAIEVTASGTYTLTGNTFTGYGPNGDSFDPQAINLVDDEITISGHNFSTGDPVFYERAGDSGNPLGSGVTDSTPFYAVKKDVDTIVLTHSYRGAVEDGITARHIETFNSGTIQYLYSANAAIYNTSGGHVTLNIVGGNEPSVYNQGLSTTTVNISVPLEINNLTEGSYAAMIGDGGAEDGNILLEGYADSTGKVTGSFSGTTPQVVGVRARNGGIILAALQDDATVFTDYTLDARNRTSPGTGTTNDVELLPATPALNDAFYFAGLNVFEELLINVTTAGSTYVLAWEYWNGSAWSSLTVTDNTNSFQTTGWNTVGFTDPGDWSTTSVDSKGPYYYIRARVTTGGGSGASAETITLKKTIQYQSFTAPGTIQSSTGLTATAVWQEDTINS